MIQLRNKKQRSGGISTTALLLFRVAAISAGIFFCTTPSFSQVSTQKTGAQKPATESIYRAVPPQKSLGTSPQFILIDDFSSKELKNIRGGIWHIRNAPARRVGVSRPRQDARNPDKNGGFSLKLDLDLPQNKEVILRSSLEKLDVSHADAVVFSCKSFYVNRGGFPGTIRLVMQDWKGKQSFADLTALCSSGNWNEVVLAKARFAVLDWDQLSTISFVISSGQQPVKGFFQIDEIAFYGAKMVFGKPLRLSTWLSKKTSFAP